MDLTILKYALVFVILLFVLWYLIYPLIFSPAGDVENEKS